MLFLSIFGGFIGLLFVYLVVFIFFPVLKVKAPSFEGELGDVPAAPSYRKNVEYTSMGVTIRSWLYVPEKTDGPYPCVILCNGFGGTKDIILEQYAKRFADEGIASIALEYRHYGESDGQPRQFYSSTGQLEDIQASVQFARSLKEIDSSKILIWGTSAGGGYGINIAADDHEICGVISQCSAWDHKKDDKLIMKREGIGFMFRLIAHAQRDKGRSRFNLSPHTIPLLGEPYSTSMLNAPGGLKGYAGIVHKNSLFKNEICPRIMLMKQADQAVNRIVDVTCPVLLLVCENDELIAPGSHEIAVERLGDRVQLHTYPIGHFDIYKGEHFEKAVGVMIEFIKRVIQ